MLCPQFIRFFLLAAMQRQPFRKIGNTADLFTANQIQSDKTAQRQCLTALQLIPLAFKGFKGITVFSKRSSACVSRESIRVNPGVS